MEHAIVALVALTKDCLFHYSPESIVHENTALGEERAPRSEQLFGVVDELPVHEMRFARELVWSRRASGIYVKNLVAMCQVVVRNQHAMAVKINALGAHVRRGSGDGELADVFGSELKPRGEHVIGVMAKRV